MPLLQDTKQCKVEWLFSHERGRTQLAKLAEFDPFLTAIFLACHATDSDLTDDDVIVRYENGEIVGLTILHASKR